MRTKLLAAGIATRSGCAMAIALGKQNHPLRALLDGARCSWFLPQTCAQTARKQWIAGSLTPAGEIMIDNGAADALRHGGSLLPAGVLGVRGDFTQGDLVVVTDNGGRVLARGLSAYDADDARLIAGHRSSELAEILGWQGRDEIIHRMISSSSKRHASQGMSVLSSTPQKSAGLREGKLSTGSERPFVSS